MDTSKAKKSSEKENTQERQFTKVESFDVSHVRVVDSKNGDLVFFSLTINGVTINSCRVATGKNGDFISFPQTQGKNGDYYSLVYVSLDNKDVEKILDRVQEEVNNL